MKYCTAAASLARPTSRNENRESSVGSRETTDE